MQSAAPSSVEQKTPIETITALTLQAICAANKLRGDQSVRLNERALAIAEETQPGDSLVIASLLRDIAFARIMTLFDGATAPRDAAARRNAARRDDLDAFRQSRRSLELLLARNKAGKLFSMTTAETTFFEAIFPDSRAAFAGPALLVDGASFAFTSWAYPARFQPAGGEATLDLLMRAVVAALRLVVTHFTLATSGEREFTFSKMFSTDSRDECVWSVDVTTERMRPKFPRTAGMNSSQSATCSGQLCISGFCPCCGRDTDSRPRRRQSSGRYSQASRFCTNTWSSHCMALTARR